MTAFVLVHGAWHAPWCWERVTPELKRLGHHVSTVNLPAGDPWANTESFVRSIDPAIDDPADTVLVAHSAASLVAPIVVERRPVRELVLLAGILPKPGLSFFELVSTLPVLQTDFGAAQAVLTTDEYGGLALPEADALRFMYHDSAQADAKAAVSRLRVEYATAPYAEKTEFVGGLSTPVRYVSCTLDRAISREWAIDTAKADFNATVVEFESSHTPFWSQPFGLAELLAAGR